MIPVQFRAWDTKGKIMLDWCCMNQSAFNILAAQEQHKATGPYMSLLYNIFNTPNFILMQLTGECDNQGKKIWVSDIYRYQQPLVKAGRQVYKEHLVVVENSLESLWKVHCLASNENCEVIGNIYENPELREV